MTVDAIAVEHVRDWFASMAERPGIANRSMPVLSTMMKMAELWGYPHRGLAQRILRQMRVARRRLDLRVSG